MQRLPRPDDRRGVDDDFETFHQLENAFLPYNRNGVLFPARSTATFAMLSRPSDTGHTPFGDIFYSESPDMEYWGRHRHVMPPAAFEVSAWQCMKSVRAPFPSRPRRGGCSSTTACCARATAMSTPSARRCSTSTSRGRCWPAAVPYLISPRETYECMGDVPNVTFPCASLHDPETGRVAVYYGCADTVTGLAFGYIPEIIEFTKKTRS